LHLRVLDERFVIMIQKLDLSATQLLQFAFNIGSLRVSKQRAASARQHFAESVAINVRYRPRISRSGSDGEFPLV
jgi:hypothetical protein